MKKIEGRIHLRISTVDGLGEHGVQTIQLKPEEAVDLVQVVFVMLPHKEARRLQTWIKHYVSTGVDLRDEDTPVDVPVGG